MSIADTLIEISNESLLNFAEKKSLRLIAKEVEAKGKRIEEFDKRIEVIQRNRDSIYNQNCRNYKRVRELEIAKTIGIQACDLLKEQIEELEADLANYKGMAAKAYTACGNYQQRITELEAEIQEVSDQLMELYDKCSDTTEPEVYGTVLGLHERLEAITLKG